MLVTYQRSSLQIHGHHGNLKQWSYLVYMCHPYPVVLSLKKKFHFGLLVRTAMLFSKPSADQCNFSVTRQLNAPEIQVVLNKPAVRYALSACEKLGEVSHDIKHRFTEMT